MRGRLGVGVWTPLRYPKANGPTLGRNYISARRGPLGSRRIRLTCRIGALRLVCSIGRWRRATGATTSGGDGSRECTHRRTLVVISTIDSTSRAQAEEDPHPAHRPDAHAHQITYSPIRKGRPSFDQSRAPRPEDLRTSVRYFRHLPYFWVAIPPTSCVSGG